MTKHSNHPFRTAATPPEPEIVYDSNDERMTQQWNNDHSQQDNKNDKSHHEYTNRQVGGAAVAGGVLGLVVGGPILAVVGAGAGAVAVTSTKSKAARATGDAVAATGSRIKEWNQQTGATKKVSRSIVKGANWVEKRMSSSSNKSSSSSNSSSRNNNRSSHPAPSAPYEPPRVY